MGGFANNAPIVTDGLVFYVDAGNSKSYDGVSGGTTWTDLVRGKNGTLTNMDTNPASGGYVYDSANGGSLVFDGSDDYVIFPYNSDFNFQPTEAFTISFWVKDFTLSSSDTPFCNLNQSSPYQGWEVVFYDNSITFSFIKVWNSNAIRVGILPTITTSNWHNIVVVYDGSCPSNSTDAVNSVKFYIDSAIDNTSQSTRDGASQFSSTSESITYNTSNNRLNIGERGSGASYAINYLGKGAAYSLYNRALSASEITQNYNALKNRFV